MRGDSKGAGIGRTKTNGPGGSHGIFGCTGSDRNNGIRRPTSRTAVRHTGEKLDTKNIRTAKPDARIEIRWRPAHSGAAGNERADEGARQAAEELDA